MLIHRPALNQIELQRALHVGRRDGCLNVLPAIGSLILFHSTTKTLLLKRYRRFPLIFNNSVNHTMTTRELKKLNKYPEFENNSDIDEIIDFIASDYNDYPERLITQRQRNRYFEKFGAESHFEVRNVNGAPTLFYNPVAQINLEVARPSQRERETKMQQI